MERLDGLMAIAGCMVDMKGWMYGVAEDLYAMLLCCQRIVKPSTYHVSMQYIDALPPPTMHACSY